MMTRDLSWAPKADFVKILLPLLAAAGFSRLRGGPKRLKTDPFEVKNAQSTSNGTVLRVLKKLGPFEKALNFASIFQSLREASGRPPGASGRPPGAILERFWLDFGCSGGLSGSIFRTCFEACVMQWAAALAALFSLVGLALGGRTRNDPRRLRRRGPRNYHNQSYLQKSRFIFCARL